MAQNTEVTYDAQNIAALIDDMFFTRCDNYLSRLCGSGKRVGSEILFELSLTSFFTHNLLANIPKKSVLSAIQKHEKISFKPEQTDLNEIENNLKNFSLVVRVQASGSESFLTKIASVEECSSELLKEEIGKIGNVTFSIANTNSTKDFFVTFQSKDDVDLVQSKLPSQFSLSMISMPSEVLSSFSKTKHTPVFSGNVFYPEAQKQKQQIHQYNQQYFPRYQQGVYYPGMESANQSNYNNNSNNNQLNNNRNRDNYQNRHRNEHSKNNRKQNRNRNFNRRGDYQQQQQQQQQQPVQKLNTEPTYFPPLSSAVRSGYPASAPAKQYSLAEVQKIVKETIVSSFDKPKSELFKTETCVAEKPLSNVFTETFAEAEPENVSIPTPPKTGTSYADIARSFSPAKNLNFSSPPLVNVSEKKTIIRKKQINENETDSDE